VPHRARRPATSSAWTSAAVDRDAAAHAFAQAFEARVALVVRISPLARGVELIVTHGLGSEEQEAWRRHLSAHPPETHPWGHLVPGRPLAEATCWRQGRIASVCRAFLDAQKVGPCLCVRLEAESSEETVVAFLFRGAGDQPFAERETSALAGMAPHLLHGVRLRERIDALARRNTAYEDLVNRFPVGLLGASLDGRIEFSNAAAEAMAPRLRGLLEAPERGARPGSRLGARVHQELVAALDARQARPLTLTSDSGVPTLLVLSAVPLAGGTDRALLVSINGPEPTGPAKESLVGLFGMTEAEAAIAARLSAGRSLSEAAADLGVRPSTARTHLKGIFHKAGVRRQADLMVLLSRLQWQLRSLRGRDGQE
jgi:DNA-binding CsgD family transcriptional regulator